MISSSNAAALGNGAAAANGRINLQQQMTNGLFIRKEIQRFESVHPNIYAVYDLIDTIQDFNLQQQIREHIVNIEDSFVNSQEWTLSRSVPDLKIGILGSVNSGKSSLVHRFLTGTYIQEESPEGGRFKKEVSIDGQSYLLLIRDEGGSPEMQFTHWIDAVIFVFSLENEESFQTVHQYYLKMQNYRNMSDIPFILVGTQDYITENNPRVIDDTRARNLANELKKCSYYETCATYGLHVERVFHDACQKVVNLRTQMLFAMANISSASSSIVSFNSSSSANLNRPSTPQQQQQQQLNGPANGGASSSIRMLAGSHMSSSNGAVITASTNVPSASATAGINGQQQQYPSPNGANFSAENMNFFQANPHLLNSIALQSTLTGNGQQQQQQQPGGGGGGSLASNSGSTNGSSNTLANMQSSSQSSTNSVFKEPLSVIQQQQSHQIQQQFDKKSNNGRLTFDMAINSASKESFQSDSGNNLAATSAAALITPLSTPNQKRKDKDTNRRRSNLFTPNKKEDKQKQLSDMGVGRSIPVKQGFLYKKTNSTINKDWKKKFVTLNDDGSLRYYPSMNDYMEESHGKEIDLQKTTIKIPGANKPRIGKSLIHIDTNRLNNDINGLSLNGVVNGGDGKTGLDEQGNQLLQPGITNGLIDHIGLARIDANSKKRHRRVKSNHKSDQNKEEEQEGFEFIIVSLDNKQWHFEAASNEEREEWVQAIEQQILSSLQLNEPNKLKTKSGGCAADNGAVLAMKSVPGNTACCDCDAPNPVWASLNHGALICIECSGIHRNLGTHLSRVRSLELDDWSNELVQVMSSIGNRMINSIYEGNVKGYPKSKPGPSTNREEKEKWIRAKYEGKQFLASLPNKEITVGKQLLDAVSRQDVYSVILCLAYSKPEDVNSSVSQLDRRTSLHIAASQANTVILQLLIWYGADVEATDNQGRNSLFYARQSNSPECVQLLLNNGCSDKNQGGMNTVQVTITSANTHDTNGQQQTTALQQQQNTLGKKSYTSTSTSYIGLLNNGSGGQNTYDKLTYNII